MRESFPATSRARSGASDMSQSNEANVSATAMKGMTLCTISAPGCFGGEALRGEPCAIDRDCGPRLQCVDGGLCGERRCPATTLELPTLAPDITLIVTYTISMSETVDELGTTRWQQVLELVGQIGEALGDRVNLGMVVAPSFNAPAYDPEKNPCYTDASTHLLPAPGQGALLLGVLPPEPPDLGEHPVGRGLNLALAGLTSQDPAGLRPQAVVIINDSTFNCRTEPSTAAEFIELFDLGLTQRVADAAASGVPVFVVGVGVTSNGLAAPFPGARFRDVDPVLAFNELAVAGGHPREGATRYYRPEDVDELVAALAAVPDAFADCRVALAEPPADPERLVVVVDGASFRAEPDCGGGRGFRYPDTSHQAVELCPETCAAFRATRALTIEQRCRED